MELDAVVSLLQNAKVAAQGEGKSRELSLAITKIDEALLWRQEDLRIKEAAPSAGA